MPRRTRTADNIRQPEHLDQLDKDGLIRFLKGDQEDKITLWNTWRESTQYRPLDLQSANLAHAQLAGIDLRTVHLEAATFNQAHLENAIFIRAHLNRAQFMKTWLTGAIMNWADLTEADLSDAHLEQADLRDVSLEGAVLHGAHLEAANLTGTRLAGADLRRVSLRDTALSPVAKGGFRSLRLYQTYFWGVLSLRYPQLLENEDDPNSLSTIWEDTQGRYSEAKDVYKSLKGYFEDAGDYGGANWAYAHEQEMAKLIFVTPPMRWLYPRRKWDQGGKDGSFGTPKTLEWLRLELSDKLAGYGLSLTRPLIWLILVIGGCGVLYALTGMLTTMPGCGYDELRTLWREGCQPTHNLLDGLRFSIGALTTIDVGGVQPYFANVGLLAALEALFGIALTGLFGFVLGNKLRNS